MKEILWHGRGGQGVVLAAQILAEAAYLEGYGGVTSAPTFGPERRGAPVVASTRISRNPIRTVAQIEAGDVAVVLDASLFGMVDILGRLREGGPVIVNTPSSPGNLGIGGCFTLATVDATEIAVASRLIVGGMPVVNTPMLGAFCRVTGLVTLENIEKALKRKMPSDAARANFAVVQAAFEKTVVREKEEKRDG
jgi:2-oxoacid:acceptor oxidoreductase gamma subunit (pyruvate/2-ketoisovalerate family)